MSTFVEILEAGRSGKVTYYSLQKEDKEKNETQIFQERYGQDAKYSENYGELANILLEIGQRGAKARYFRHERNAHALPPNYVHGDGLRLYCLRLTDEIVILGGGCFKDTRTAQESAQCRSPFSFMDRVAKALTAAIRDRTLIVFGVELKGDMTLII